MKFILQFIFIISIGCTLQFTANAQEITKTRVAFHKNVYRITVDMDKKLKYFSTRYPDFYPAQLYKIDDTEYQLEIEKKANGGISVSSKSLTPSEFQALKEAVSKRIIEEEIGVKYDHSGRFLKVQSLAFQGLLGGYSITSLIVENSDNYGAALAMPYIGLGSGILGGVYGTARKDVPIAPTLAYASGASTGSYHGFLVGNLFLDYDDFDNYASTLLLTSTAFSVGESLLLQHIVKKNEWSAQRASALRLGNLSGGITGVGLALLLGGNDGNKYLATGVTLAGSTAGILLYDRYFRNKDIKVGNMQAIRLMNPVFTIGASIVIGDLLNVESTPALGATIMATNIGAVFLGEALFKRGNVTYNESLWYGLGLYGGSLIGLGVSTIVTYNNFNYESYAATFAGITTVFGLGGMYLVHSLVANDYDDEGDIGFFEKNNLHISGNPASLYVNKFITNPAHQQSAVSIRWSF